MQSRLLCVRCENVCASTEAGSTQAEGRRTHLQAYAAFETPRCATVLSVSRPDLDHAEGEAISEVPNPQCQDLVFAVDG